MMKSSETFLFDNRYFGLINKKNKMKISGLSIFFFFFSILLFSQTETTDKILIDKIAGQLIIKEKIIRNKFPEYTEGGEWKFREKVNWLSGFLSGELWYLHELTGKKEYEELAVTQTDQLLPYSGIDITHDMGFIFLPGCLKAYKATANKKYLTALLEAAGKLAERFNKNGNFIRAWGSLRDTSQAGLMIIDTMMNLELLFIAAELSGRTDYFDIAYKHSLTTLHESLRNDFSSFHVVDFDPATGQVIRKRTHQGFADSSTWARGQAWGIYGFANAYKYTGDDRFLYASQRMADYFIKHLPEDNVPVWDLNLCEKEPRDASAAAIAASGLFLLAEISGTEEAEKKYSSFAEKISSSLLKNYLFTSSKRKTEGGLLLHTIYHFHKRWGVDESFPAGDYYLMESLVKYLRYMYKRNFVKDKCERQEYLLNNDWFYLEDNLKNAAETAKSDCVWKKINLPHTWNNFDATDNIPGYRRDASWYKRELYIPYLDNYLNLILHFEGVNVVSEVYVNGLFAGGHVGGYLGFDVDITPYIKKGTVNTIQVRADNSINRDIIPSQKSDFFIYGGINRDVWLKVLPPTYLVKAKIITPDVSEKEAATNIELNFVAAKSALYEIKATVRNKSGEMVSATSVEQEFWKGHHQIAIDLPVISNPLLWSTDDPNLYQLSVEIFSNGKLLDKLIEKFGYRWFEFKSNGAFYLNGKKLLIRGTHWHEDYAGLGNAVPDPLKEKDFKMIKEMGANFVRLAHYPQDPYVYRLCDELGILVWDELPWCRAGLGGTQWKKNTVRMLNEMLDQNFNHPSIIIWSLGNEIYWLPDFPDGDNNDSLRAFLKVLNDIAHHKDPSRLTGVRKYYEGADIVDVFSPSIWAGWYSGVYKNYRTAIDDSRRKYPRLLHMEYGGSSHVGRHSELPVNGEGILSPDEWEELSNQVKIKNIASMSDWNENYIVDLFDWHLKYSEQSDSFAGNAQWAFKDFGTPLRPENPIPYMNQKGLVDRAGNPKDAFYVFKSYWNKNDKFCYIESHTWTARCGPENLKREVNVFSNCDKVELFHNGKSLGLKEKDITNFPASGLSWELLFEEGANNLKAAGYSDSGIFYDSILVNYTYKKAGNPDKIILSQERLANGNYLITAVVADNTGQRCLSYNKRIYFSISGKGRFLENYGTPAGSSIIEAANGKAQIEFHPSGYDPIVIEVRNQDFKGDYIIIN